LEEIMNLKQISIDFDVHKEIELRRESFEDSPNDVLRRVFDLKAKPDFITRSFPQIQSSSGDFSIKGVTLKDGLSLRKYSKGTQLQARVREGKIEFNGQFYSSPSAAASAATNTSTNGWVFWEYWDDKSNEWRILNSLRRESRRIKILTPIDAINNKEYSALKNLIIKDSGKSPNLDLKSTRYTDDLLLLIAAKLLGIKASVQVHRYDLFACVQSHLAAKSEEQLQGTIERSTYWRNVFKGSGRYILSDSGFEYFGNFPLELRLNPLINSIYTFSKNFKGYCIEVKVDSFNKQLMPAIKDKAFNSSRIVSFLEDLGATWKTKSSTSTTKIWNWIIQSKEFTWARENRRI